LHIHRTAGKVQQRTNTQPTAASQPYDQMS
jgi:hypothetical protein